MVTAREETKCHMTSRVPGVEAATNKLKTKTTDVTDSITQKHIRPQAGAPGEGAWAGTAGPRTDWFGKESSPPAKPGEDCQYVCNPILKLRNAPMRHGNPGSSIR